MVERLAAEQPFWEPGTRNGYHMITFGWVVGELVRRVSGRSLGTFFREEVAEPLGLDFWIGLPDAHLLARRRPMIPWFPDGSGPPMPFTQALISDPNVDSIPVADEFGRSSVRFARRRMPRKSAVAAVSRMLARSPACMRRSRMAANTTACGCCRAITSCACARCRLRRWSMPRC